MDQQEPVLRNISDTALWAAVHRARESERPDAVFRDPFARRLAGEHGERIALGMASNDPDWPWTCRTYLFDRFIKEQVAQGVDMVINLAAGLDARPYHMDFPPALQWVEIDLPDPLAYKEELLKADKPICSLERIPLDLSQVAARREVFERLSRRATRALILTEGLLIYLSTEDVAALAEDLARPASFQRWAIDLASPGLKGMLMRQWERQLGQAGAPFKFAPPEGPGFFTAHHWRPVEVHSLLKTAARLRRLSFWMRLLALLPASNGRQGSRPWGGICLPGSRLGVTGLQGSLSI
jgi:methyltransferase (TIGR00027 family)